MIIRYFILGLFAFCGYTYFSPSIEPAVLFINSLDEEQSKRAIFPFEHSKRKDWHYLPAGSYERAGLKLSELTDLQKEYVFELIESVLSSKGMRKTRDIIDLENILAELEQNFTHRDPGQYALAIFGNPAKKSKWSWSFSGHHISYHFTYVNGKIASSPRFLGANPGEVQNGEKAGLRVLAMEEDLGLELVRSMSEEQLKSALIDEQGYMEIITRNEEHVDPFANNGLSENDMSTAQKELLDQLIEEYLSCLKTPLAENEKHKIQNEKLHFAWAGPMKKGEPHYYRIQGESFLVEFDNAQNGANHVHTVWRSFDGDFGEDLLREHRLQHQH